ncbi:uncharacterized protein CELE_F27B3.6 [Caenorhabditis elegans]|uniref:Uncharacterized protein n=1 Tax=Caenorhabditis elegans TaxID=6239 RepID=Q9N5U9_CAEEL|nr:Uncharacterized protein CELE_F27B3.6 [Caenorhabditis elegans]CCD63923.1 Uncharacterized protein CELE_F27B3.6 [Caenorhabditis elegans]|eukprot:NP_498451.1 Uncharacterized protein CELE_F27B3.6 [Caenorhabditis elegans]
MFTMSKNIKGFANMIRTEDPMEVFKAVEGLLEMEIPFKYFERYNLKDLILSKVLKSIGGLLIRRLQVTLEEKDFEDKFQKEDPESLEDGEMEEIQMLMMTPTKNDFMRAQQQLDECGYKDLPEDIQESHEFTRALTVIDAYRCGHETPEPTTEFFKIDTSDIKDTTMDNLNEINCMANKENRARVNKSKQTSQSIRRIAPF